MSAAVILKFVIMSCAALFIAGIVWWARKHPNRSKQYPEQVRMPKVVAFIGWLFVCVGAIMALVAFTSEDADDPIAFRIASVAIVVGGVAFVMMYRNFYVAPRAYEVAFRSILGREHVLAYSDIVYHRVVAMNGQPILTVKSADGVKLSLNIRTFDMSPLLHAIDFHEATGRWPGRAEARIDGLEA